MNTNDPCIKLWFGGVSNFLDTASEPERSSFLAHCAKACSDSYPLALYRTAFSEGRTISEALEYLKDSFSGFSYTIFSDRIELEYPECGCDLFKEGLITSPRLCECSEASLLYIWQDIFGPGTVSVVTKKTRIGGDECCLFEIRVAPLGHTIPVEGAEQ